MSKSVDLFGNEVPFTELTAGKKKPFFDNYEEFVDKFKPKKTTDDCYTPPDVYNCVLSYVMAKCDIKGDEIVRPFYPGGDFERCDYPNGCVVVDNPPFSIISRIANFYIDNNIKFFLFAPHLTLFSPVRDYTRIVVGAPITYENGAIVKTSFISNLFEDIAVMSDVDLYNDLKRINKSKKAALPKYVYPDEVLTVSAVQWCLEKGISLQFKKGDVYHIQGLDGQKLYGKTIFGAGYLLSEKAAAEKAAAEKAAAEREVVIKWTLSDRERKIIESMS